MLAHQVLELTGGDKTVTAISILFVSAVASSIVDNIPFSSNHDSINQKYGS